MSRASPTVSDNSGNGQLRAFVERILRLKEEQDTIAADIREIYAEAKGTGFDKTAMGQLVAYLRKVEKVGAPAVEERQTVFDLYLDAYQRATGMPLATHTHEAESLDPKLVETIAKAVQTKAGTAALLAAVDIMIEREEAHDPETGELHSSGMASERIDPSTVSVNPNGEPVDGSASEGGNDDDRRMMALTIGSGSGAPVVAAPATISDEDVPAFIKAEKNERCEKQGTCKFARHPHKITCSDCGTAWAISQRKRERAE